MEKQKGNRENGKNGRHKDKVSQVTLVTYWQFQIQEKPTLPTA
jgi:hypothetical protein